VMHISSESWRSTPAILRLDLARTAFLSKLASFVAM
jgi:hypothetical protein